MDVESFESACFRGDIEKVKSMSSDVSKLVSGFYNACSGGHMEIVEFIMSLFSENWENVLGLSLDVWDSGLCCACKGGHIDIVNLMFRKGAKSFYFALQTACIGGDMEIINLCISKFTDVQKLVKALNGAFYGACEGGNLGVVEFIISKADNFMYLLNYNAGLYYACQGGNINIILLMISRGANDWNRGLRGACHYGKVSAAEFMIYKGANNLDECLNSSNENVSRLLVSKGGRRKNETNNIDLFETDIEMLSNVVNGDLLRYVTYII
jgi:ankyrin repeat protein